MTGTTASLVALVGLLVAGLVLEARARTRPGAATATQTLAAAMRTTPGRLVVLVAWLWLGVHFLAR